MLARRQTVKNRLLATMSPDDFALLGPYLEYLTIDKRRGLEDPKRPITHIYFIERGVMSVVSVGKRDHWIEVGLTPRSSTTSSSSMTAR